MLEYAEIEEKVTTDFDTFDFADKPMENYCAYNYMKHIQMATQLTLNAFSEKACYSETEIDDFVHGLNHLFFNGVAAGQSFERLRKQCDSNKKQRLRSIKMLEITFAFMWRWVCGWTIGFALIGYSIYQSSLFYNKLFTLRCQNWQFYFWSIMTVISFIFCLFANGVL